ncbi:hypothetical protein EF903_24230 [Streptomyces sp. WAC05292]|uniref:hypothetical protein n=1 Tax=Streptomyces sp. WAC05292 TaxID=2487418 RepID=UPI000F742753|nr:hypothetical protein [Streptomyces sp. WAC05292]RSS84347.1 hypothetical protein EF903_24230 [Streptomyces sp. WAC05292]
MTAPTPTPAPAPVSVSVLSSLGRLAEVHELRPYAEARAEARAEALAEQQRRQVLQQVSGGSPAVRDTVESTPRVLEGQR